MRSDPEGILEAAFHAYAMGDLPAAAAYFAEDVVYAIYVDKDELQFGGEVRGRAAILAVWQDIRLRFENLQYAPRVVSCEDDIVRCQIDFAFRHRASGEEIDGVMRVVAQIADGKIVRFREYHDQERLRAFMRLVAKDSLQMPDF